MKSIDEAEIKNISERFLEIKEIEIELKAERETIESALIDWLGAKEEGAKVHTIGDYKITITGRMTRSVDADVWDDVYGKIPEDLRAVVNWKPSLDLRGLRYIQENEPEVYKVLAKAITVKPAKTSVTITKKEVDNE